MTRFEFTLFICAVFILAPGRCGKKIGEESEAAQLPEFLSELDLSSVEASDEDVEALKRVVKRLAPERNGEYQVYQGVTGQPGVDFPALTSIPATSFSCRGLKGGYYADLETNCQVFHICDNGRKISFLCPNGTIFQQSQLICDWWFKVDCSRSTELYEQSAEQLAQEEKKRNDLKKIKSEFHRAAESDENFSRSFENPDYDGRQNGRMNPYGPAGVKNAPDSNSSGQKSRLNQITDSRENLKNGPQTFASNFAENSRSGLANQKGDRDERQKSVSYQPISRQRNQLDAQNKFRDFNYDRSGKSLSYQGSQDAQGSQDSRNAQSNYNPPNAQSSQYSQNSPNTQNPQYSQYSSSSHNPNSQYSQYSQNSADSENSSGSARSAGQSRGEKTYRNQKSRNSSRNNLNNQPTGVGQTKLVTPLYTEATTFRTSTPSPREFQQLAESAAFVSNRGNRFGKNNHNYYYNAYSSVNSNGDDSGGKSDSVGVTESPEVGNSNGYNSYQSATFASVFKPRTTTIVPFETTLQYSTTDRNFYKDYGNDGERSGWSVQNVRDGQDEESSREGRNNRNNGSEDDGDGFGYARESTSTTETVHYSTGEFFTTTEIYFPTESYENRENIEDFENSGRNESRVGNNKVIGRDVDRDVESLSTNKRYGTTETYWQTLVTEDFTENYAATTGVGTNSNERSAKAESFARNFVSTTEKPLRSQTSGVREESSGNSNLDLRRKSNSSTSDSYRNSGKTLSPYDTSFTYKQGKEMSTLGPYIPFTKNYVYSSASPTTTTRPPAYSATIPAYTSTVTNYRATSKSLIPKARNYNENVGQSVATKKFEENFHDRNGNGGKSDTSLQENLHRANDNSGGRNFQRNNIGKSDEQNSKSAKPSKYLPEARILENRPATEREHALSMIHSLQGLGSDIPTLAVSATSTGSDKSKGTGTKEKDRPEKSPRKGIPNSRAPSTLHSLALYFATADSFDSKEKPSTPNYEEEKIEKPKRNDSGVELPTSILTQHTITSYAELFKLNNALESNATHEDDFGEGGSVDVGNRSDKDGDDSKDADADEDLDIQQSEGPVSGARKSNGTKLRELAQVFTHALSAYLQDPDTFKKVLTEIRPTEPTTTDLSGIWETTREATTIYPTTFDEYPSVTKEKDEVLDFSDDSGSVRRRKLTTTYPTTYFTTYPAATARPTTFSNYQTTVNEAYSTSTPAKDRLYQTTTPARFESTDRAYGETESGTSRSAYGKSRTYVQSPASFAIELNYAFGSTPNDIEAYSSDPLEANQQTENRIGGFQNNTSQENLRVGKYTKDVTPILDNFVSSTTPAYVEIPRQTSAGRKDDLKEESFSVFGTRKPGKAVTTAYFGQNEAIGVTGPVASEISNSLLPVPQGAATTPYDGSPTTILNGVGVTTPDDRGTVTFSVERSTPTPYAKNSVTTPYAKISSTAPYAKISNTAQSPRISSSTQSSRIFSTTQTPRIFNTEQSPRILSSTQSPRILSSTQNPRILSSTQSSRIFSTTQSPRILNTEQSPIIFSTTQSPRILSTTQSPRILSTTQSPRILSTTQNERILSTSQSPRISSTVQSPRNSNTSPNPRISNTSPFSRINTTPFEDIGLTTIVSRNEVPTSTPFRIRYFETSTPGRKSEHFSTGRNSYVSFRNSFGNWGDGARTTERPLNFVTDKGPDPVTTGGEEVGSTGRVSGVRQIAGEEQSNVTTIDYGNTLGDDHWTSSPSVTQLWETTVFIDPKKINHGLEDDSAAATLSTNKPDVVTERLSRSTTPSVRQASFVTDPTSSEQTTPAPSVRSTTLNQPTPWQWAPSNNDAPTAFTLLPSNFEAENTATPTPIITTRSSITTTITSSVTSTSSLPQDALLSSLLPYAANFDVNSQNVTENEIVKAQEMFGKLNSTSSTTLMRVMKQADDNETVRQLVLLLISQCNGPMDKNKEEEKERLLNALLRMPVNEFHSDESREIVAGINRLNLPDKEAQPSTQPSTQPSRPPPTTSVATSVATSAATTGTTTPSITTFRSRGGRRFRTTTDTSNSIFARRSDEVESSESKNSLSDDDTTTSDGRAIELLRSLYTIAAKWG